MTRVLEIACPVCAIDAPVEAHYEPKDVTVGILSGGYQIDDFDVRCAECSHAFTIAELERAAEQETEDMHAYARECSEDRS